MIGDMSDVIKAFEHPIIYIKKGTGQLVKGLWQKGEDTRIEISGVIIFPNTGMDEFVQNYPGMKVIDGQCIIYTVQNLTGLNLTTQLEEPVVIELEEKIEFEDITYKVLNFLKFPQQCNVKGYMAEKVNPE